jgi:hypothetical protein
MCNARPSARRRRSRVYWGASFLTVVVVGLWTILERLDNALRGLVTAKSTTLEPPTVSTAGKWAWWVVVGLAILCSVALFALALQAAGERAGLAQNAVKRRRLRWVVGSLLVVWTAWVVSDALSATFDGWQWLRVPQEIARIVVAVLLVATIVGLGNAFGASVGFAWRQASAVRVQLVVVGLLFAFAYAIPLTSGQAADVMRAWTDEGFTRVFAALAASVLLGEMIRESGLRFVQRREAKCSGNPDLAHRRAFRALAAMPTVVLFVGSVGAATDSVLLVNPLDDEWVFWSCVGAAAVAVVLLLLVRTTLHSSTQDPADAEAPLAPKAVREWLAKQTERPPTAWVLAGILMVAGTVAGILVALVPLVVGGVLALALWFIEVQRRAGLADEPIRGALPLNVVRGFALGVAIAVLWEPIGTARGLGALAVILIGLAAILSVLHTLAYQVGERRIPWLRVRVPVLSLLAVYFAVGTQIGPQTQHEVRTVAAEPAQPTRLRAAVRAWLSQELAATTAANGGAPPDYLPLLLVGASGGGSKAGYWTDVVLDCVVGGGQAPEDPELHDECADPDGDRPTRERRARGLFLTSSVSGGSVGIRNYVSRLPDVLAGNPWVDDAAGHEILSPTLAWGLFHDLPASALWPIGLWPAGLDPRKCDGAWSCRLHLDRAAIQEQAIADLRDHQHPAWDDAPKAADALSTLWRQSSSSPDTRPVPLTVFNSAVSGSLGRTVSSPVDLASLSLLRDPCRPVQRTFDGALPGAIDDWDMLGKREGSFEPDEDLALTSAALLSARFPVVDPVGRLGDADSSQPKPPDNRCLDSGVQTLPALYLRDGGYVENSGLLTIAELAPAIERAVRGWSGDHAGAPPVRTWVLSIDDDATNLDAVGQVSSERPGPTSIGTRAGDVTLTVMARDALALGEAGVACSMRISPPPRIGAHASTGWELSVTVRLHDLLAATTTPTNARRIGDVRTFLDGEDPSGGTSCQP